LATVVVLLFVVACGASESPASQPAPSIVNEPAAQPAQPAAAQQQASAQAPAAETPGSPQSSASKSGPVPTAIPAQVASDAPVATVTESPEGTLRMGLDEVGPPKWIPKIQGAPQNSINNTTFWESLWSNKRGEGLHGVLAESWEISDDSTIWTIRIRQGVPFHHGYGDMTAADFVWTMDNTVEEGTTQSAEVYLKSFFAKGGGMTVLDDGVIEVDTVVPRFDLTWFMTMGMTNSMGLGVASKKYHEEAGAEAAGFSEAVGTGPWRSVEHQTGGTWKFEAVEDHWRKPPNFSELHIVEVSEESTRLANFQANTLDTAKFNLESMNLLEQSCQDCKFMSFPTGGQLFIIIHGQMYIPREEIKPLNPALPWISSNPDINSPEWEQARKVRLAMNVAIDRRLLADELLRGKGAPIHVYGWAGFEDSMDYLADLKYEYDPDRARQLLAEAGYPDGIEVPMALTNRPYPSTIETAEAVATMWEEAGIRTIQTRQPMSSFRAKFPDRSWEGVNSHGQAIQIEPTAVFTRLFSTKGFINYGVEHPIAEDLTDRVNETFDDEERLELVRQFAKFLFDESLVIPTVSVFQVWPLGAKIDEWETLCCVTRNLTNLEYIPHR
jgi:peptide/nickel transport system substrate-binding protein